MLLVALMAPWAAMAQETLTVYGDGTVTNRFVPIDGYNVDGTSIKSEYIMPASVLTAMNGKDITKMTIYLSTVGGNSWGNATFRVFMKEVENTTISSFTGYSDATVVYLGGLDCTQPTMDVNFTENYSYNGGNLLIGFYIVTTGSYTGSWNSYNPLYAGETVTGASIGGTSATQQNFLPKTTFTYQNQAACPKPSGLIVNGLTATWNAGTASQWNLQYKKVSESTWTPVNGLTAATYTFTGLAAQTDYEVQVQADCVSETSEWTNSFNFTTPCDVIATLPWTEDFEDFTDNTVPDCWDNSATTGTDYNSYPERYWGVYSYGGNKMIRVYNYYAHGPSAIINSQPITLPSTGEYELTFDYSNLANCGPFKVNISDDGGATFAEKGSYASAGTTNYTDPGTFTPAAPISLASYSGKTIIIQFYATPNYNSGAIFVDNVKIDVPPTCQKPTDLECTGTTSTTATLSWTNGASTQTAWQICLNGDEEHLIMADRNPFTITTGLTPTTTYTAKVRAYCDQSDQSEWSNTINFTTGCPESYPLDYTCGFEGPNTTGSNPMPMCWTRMGSNTTIPNVSTSYHHGEGSRSLYFYKSSSSTYTNEIAALPAIDANMNTVRVVFYGRLSSSSTDGTINVGYVTDLADATTFQSVQTVTLTTNWEKYTISFGNVGDANGNIAFQALYSTASASIYIDDVLVEEIPSCLAPTGLAANATSTSAELSWTANSGETAWTVYYKKTTDETYTEVANATNPYTLNGLDAATNYQYYVVANCSADDASEASEVFPFVTECEVIAALGYSENFDSYTAAAGVLPICWNKINTTTYSYYQGYPRVYANGSYSIYANSAPNCLYFYSYYSSSYDPQPQYAILPEMTGLAGKQVTLMAKGYSSTSTFKIGTMSDPADASTFVAITEQALTTSYQQFEYLIPANAQGNYLAIMIDAATASRTSNGVYIDDITIAEPPACPKPTDLTVVANSVTPHSVQLSWVSDATAWIVAYKTAEEEEFTEVDATENPYTLTGLTDGKTYTAKVCAVCDGTPGEWTSNTVSFTTPIACPAPTNLAVSGTTGSQTTLNWAGTSDSYDVLYRTAAYAEGIYENFGTSIPSGWEMYTGLLTNGTATLTPSTYVWSFGTGNGVFDNHARVNIYDNNQRWLVTKAFTVSQDASTLSFDLALTAFSGTEVPAPATTGTDDKFIVLISTDNMSSWITLREWNNSGSEYVYNNISNTATGENVVIDLSAYVGQRVRIAFYGESTTSNADNNLHIDNVHCGIPHEAGEWQTAAEGVTDNTYTLTGLNPETDYEAKVLSNCEGETGHETVISFTTEAACMVPTELTVVSVTTTTAELTWTSSSTAWQIQVNEEEPIDVTAIPYTLEGLTPATTYTFKVRANCDGSYTDWSNAESFTTDCGVIAAEGYSENFDSYEVATNYTAPSVRVLPNCWSAINTTTYSSYMQLPSIYYYSSTNYANTTPNCLKFYSYYSSYYECDPQPQYAILPEMTGLAGMQVTLQARGHNTSSTFKIGTMSDPTDASTFTMIVEQTGLTTSYQEFEYLIPADCQNSYLAIMIDAANEDRTSNGVYIDDIVISTPPTCLKPTDLEVTAPTTTTATFSWTNGAADQTAWQICLNGDETNLIMADSNPFTIEDLSASTAYTAKVRAYCSEEDQSDWSNEVSFATECEAYTITAEAPYTQDFENPVVTTIYDQIGEMPVCWENYPATSASAKILAANATYNYAESGQVLYFYGSGDNYAVLPEFTNDLNTLQISFKYATESNSYGTLTLGYITDEDENYNSFTAIEGGTFAASTESDDTFVDVEPIDLSALPANATRLVFRWYYSSQWGCNVDDVEVSLLPPTTVTQTIALAAGSNWVSFNVDITLDDLKAAIQAALPGNTATAIIASKQANVRYMRGRWAGQLNALDPTQMYKITVSDACEIVLEGMPVDPTELVVTIVPGANWIAYPFATSSTPTNFFSGFAINNDQVSSKTQSSRYRGRWAGQLNTLEPGQGYIYFSAGAEDRFFSYPTLSKDGDKAILNLRKQ